jgi:hypothetical protein
VSLRRLTKLNDVVADVKRARTLRILILDACRDDFLFVEGAIRFNLSAAELGAAPKAMTEDKASDLRSFVLSSRAICREIAEMYRSAFPKIVPPGPLYARNTCALGQSYHQTGRC